MGETNIVRRRYLGNLDLFKTLLCIMLAGMHYQQAVGWLFPKFVFLTETFVYHYLVDAFFLISGYVLTMSDTADKKSCRRSLLYRILRLYPSALLSCVFMFVMVWVIALLFEDSAPVEIPFTSFWMTAANFLFVDKGWFWAYIPSINFATWYLCVLIQCYIAFYAVKKISACVSFSRGLLYFAVLSVTLAGHSCLERMPYIPFFNGYSLRGYVPFFAGCLLYEIYDKAKPTYINIMRGIGVLTGIASVLIFGWDNWYSAVLFIYPLILDIAVHTKQINSKVIKFTGSVLYGVYLWQGVIFYLMTVIYVRMGLPLEASLHVMLLFFAVCFGVSAFVYKFIERPFLKYMKNKEEQRK